MVRETMKIKMDFGKIFEGGKIEEVEVPVQKDRTAEIRKEEMLEQKMMEAEKKNIINLDEFLKGLSQKEWTEEEQQTYQATAQLRMKLRKIEKEWEEKPKPEEHKKKE